VRGHILAAQIHAFARQLQSSGQGAASTAVSEGGAPAGGDADEGGDKGADRRRTAALGHLDQARELLAKYPSTAVLQEELDRVATMVNGGVFYDTVTKEERRAIYKAMAGEFRGTGHWYNCENGHPFTIDRCGMPMELARCPECQAPVGGANHQLVEGVQPSDEMEQLAEGMGGMGI